MPEKLEYQGKETIIVVKYHFSACRAERSKERAAPVLMVEPHT